MTPVNPTPHPPICVPTGMAAGGPRPTQVPPLWTSKREPVGCQKGAKTPGSHTKIRAQLPYLEISNPGSSPGENPPRNPPMPSPLRVSVELVRERKLVSSVPRLHLGWEGETTAACLAGQFLLVCFQLHDARDKVPQRVLVKD